MTWLFLNTFYFFQVELLWPEKLESEPCCPGEGHSRFPSHSQLKAFSLSRFITMASITTSTVTCLVLTQLLGTQSFGSFTPSFNFCGLPSETVKELAASTQRGITQEAFKFQLVMNFTKE